jgi:hypothetical protein
MLRPIESAGSSGSSQSSQWDDARPAKHSGARAVTAATFERSLAQDEPEYQPALLADRGSLRLRAELPETGIALIPTLGGMADRCGRGAL